MENIKSEAWHFLIQHKMGTFPVEVNNLKFQKVGFAIRTYNESKDFLESIEKLDYIKKYKGFSMNYECNKYIFYDEKLSFSEKNYVIAHEIGHIVLNHTLNNNNIYTKGMSDKHEKTKQEKEADIFALALLAPAPVLLEMNIYRPEGIARVTRISMKLSNDLALDIVKEKSIEKTGIEKQLIETFKETIDCYKSFEKSNEKEPKKIVNLTMDDQKNQTDMFTPVGDKIKEKNNKRPILKIGSLVISCLAITISAIIGVQKIKGDNIIKQNNNTIIQTITLPQNENSTSIITQKEISSNTDNSIEVVMTKSGTKYHLPICHYVEGKNNLKVMTKEEADKEGFSPCKTCRPNENQ